MEVVNGATRTGMSIRDWLTAAKEAGLDSIPGTAAEILDDEVRWVLTKGKLPTATWVEVVTTAHELGIRSSSTMMYGHVDQPRHWLGHLRLLARHPAGDRRLHGVRDAARSSTPTRPSTWPASPAPARPTRDNRAVTAMARLLLHPHIPNIQTSWVKLGTEGAAEMLRSGANDLGGTLMEETISRMAGSQLRLVPVGPGPGRHRGGGGPPGQAAHHAVRGGAGGAADGRPRPRTGTCRSCCRCCRADPDGRGPAADATGPRSDPGKAPRGGGDGRRGPRPMD